MSILETLMLVALSFVALVGMLATFASRSVPSETQPRRERSLELESPRSTPAKGSS